MPKRYTGTKMRRYMDATDHVLNYGFDLKKNSGIKSFVKAERTNGLAKVNPDPRMIQFRDAKYCVEVSRFLKPIEEHLYRIKGFSKGVPKSRNVAKGLNAVERAYLLQTKMSNFDNPRVLSLDASRFDKHVSASLLELEHLVYVTTNPNWWFKILLRQQIINRCFSSKGIKYKTKGRRMSGDMNTALGNCVLMLMMVAAFFKRFSKYDCMDDGDDCLVLLEHSDLEAALHGVQPQFQQFGMSLKIEHVSSTLSDVEFCQSKVIRCYQGFKFVRDPFKVMSCALSGTRYFNMPSLAARADLIYSIGTCELVLNLGVPILQEFSLAIRRNASGKWNDNLIGEAVIRFGRELKGLKMTLVDVEPVCVTNVARDDFALAFGLSVDRQLAIEKALRNWTFSIEGGTRVPDEWTVDWEHIRDSFPEVYPLPGLNED